MALRQELTDIQYGRLPDRHGWLLRLDATALEATAGTEATA
jgi:branched-chain amino acid aminotransferase